MLAGLGGTVGRIVVVGCEPAELGDGIGLSDTVSAAVDEAADAVGAIVAQIFHTEAREAKR